MGLGDGGEGRCRWMGRVWMTAMGVSGEVWVGVGLAAGHGISLRHEARGSGLEIAETWGHGMYQPSTSSRAARALWRHSQFTTQADSPNQAVHLLPPAMCCISTCRTPSTPSATDLHSLTHVQLQPTFRCIYVCFDGFTRNRISKSYHTLQRRVPAQGSQDRRVRSSCTVQLGIQYMRAHSPASVGEPTYRTNVQTVQFTSRTSLLHPSATPLPCTLCSRHNHRRVDIVDNRTLVVGTAGSHLGSSQCTSPYSAHYSDGAWSLSRPNSRSEISS